MPEKAEQRITLRLPYDVWEKMVMAAEAQDRSLNQQIVHALKDYLARQPHQS